MQHRSAISKQNFKGKSEKKKNGTLQVNFTLLPVMKAQKVSKYFTLYFTSTLRVNATLRQLHPPPPGGWWNYPVLIAQEAGWNWNPRPVWTASENLAPQPGFDPRTVQSVASRCTDWATPVQKRKNISRTKDQASLRYSIYKVFIYLFIRDVNVKHFVGIKSLLS